MRWWVLPIFFVFGPGLAVASPAGDLARDLQQVALDPGECYRIIDLNFNREDIKVYLTSGYLIFSKPIQGVRTGAVFIANVEAGDAEVLLMPPVRSERLSLANFTESPNLDEHFKTAVMVFSDGTADELLERIQATAKKSPEMGAMISEQWTGVLRNLSDSFETRLVFDLLAGKQNPGFFYLAITGDHLGNFDLLYDPTNHEQIFAGKLTERDNRHYFDDWTSFPSRSVRNGAPLALPSFALSNFQIDATIDDDLKMRAVTRVTLTPKRKLGAALPFFISRNMRVTEASIDGRPVEVFARESLRSNLIASADNQQFLLIPDTELDRARPHQVEIHQEGEVILKAGDGVYYVTSRANWYPRMGGEFANYDLTFRYPKNLTLVATGSPVDDRTEGTTRITRRKTESPIRFAGFNLGNFQSVSVTQDGYQIDVYANRHLEASLQPKGTAVFPTPMTGNPSARTRHMGEPGPESAPAPADPAARLHLLAKDVAGAVEFMTAQFGPPAQTKLAVTPIPGRFGQGFPGLVYISTLAYLNPEQRPASMRDRAQQTFFSELLDVHEVAHQWWGNLVLPASYQDEWLMEALANYSALLLLEKKKGIKAAEAVLDDYRDHLVAKQQNGHTLESAGPITWGYRLQSSLAPGAWRTVTYEKGTWIIHMLRRRLGDEKFFSLLHEVCSRYRLSTISTEQFRELASQYTAPKSPDANLKGFFENWVYGTGVPSVKLTYAWRGTKLTGTITQRDVEDDFSALIPVDVQTRAGKHTYWLVTGSEPVSFSIPMKLAPAKVGLDLNDCLMTAGK
jgi:hypothetical protein